MLLWLTHSFILYFSLVVLMSFGFNSLDELKLSAATYVGFSYPSLRNLIDLLWWNQLNLVEVDQKWRRKGVRGGGVLCGIFCPIKSFMVGKTRDCNLQSKKNHIFFCAAFDTVFRTAQSQNKKWKLNANWKLCLQLMMFQFNRVDCIVEWLHV